MAIPVGLFGLLGGCGLPHLLEYLLNLTLIPLGHDSPLSAYHYA